MAPKHAVPPLRVRVAALCLRLGVPLAGVFLLTLGLLGLLSWGVLPALEAWSARDWQGVPATLQRVTVRPHEGGLLPPFDTVEVSYRYRIGGVERVGRRLDVHDGRAVATQAALIAEALRGEVGLRAWIDPADPTRALIRREPRWDVVVFVLPALAMIVAGGVLLFVGMVAWQGGDALALRRRSRA